MFFADIPGHSIRTSFVAYTKHLYLFESYIFTRCDKVVPGLGATNLLLLLLLLLHLLLLLPVSEFLLTF
jgi:hypothetical protein